MSASTFATLLPRTRSGPDRIGVLASILCAIHCLVTPPLLLFLPAFGRAWSHPASHWIMALVVVPLALLTLRQGFRIHGRKWVIASGVVGIALILAGAALPYLEPRPVAVGEHACDACCPSLNTAATGETRLEIPPASVVTTLGGIALILAHLGNLRCRCVCCQP
jgi:hypothetical protein